MKLNNMIERKDVDMRFGTASRRHSKIKQLIKRILHECSCFTEFIKRVPFLQQV